MRAGADNSAGRRRRFGPVVQCAVTADVEVVAGMVDPRGAVHGVAVKVESRSDVDPLGAVEHLVIGVGHRV